MRVVMLKKLFMGVLILTLFGGVGYGSTFTNGSFETGSGPETKLGGNTTITGWLVLAHSIDWTSSSYWQPQQGVHAVDLSGTAAGGVSQTFDTIAGNSYQVGFYIAGNMEGSPVIKHMQVVASGNSAQVYTFDTTGHSHSSMGWHAESYLFSAAGSSTALEFRSQDSLSWGPFLDNVSVQDLGPGNSIPEPAPMGLAGTGIAVMLLVMRRHLNRAAR
jgi:choice-of-anchor C domain-containing protein